MSEIIYNKETDKYSKKETEVSKRFEDSRIELSSIIVDTNDLWKPTENMFKIKRWKEQPSKKEFLVLPREVKYKDKSVSIFYAVLERYFMSLNNGGNGNVREISGVIDDVIAARNELLETNQPLVQKITSGKVKNKPKVYRQNYPDLYQVALLAMINAAHSYDHKTGYRFSTYASSYIDGFLKNMMETDSTVRMPGNLFWRHMRIMNAVQKVSSEEEKKRIMQEAAEDAMSVDDIRRFNDNYSYRITSLDSIIKGYDDTRYIDTLRDNSNMGAEELVFNREIMDKLNKVLSPFENEIIRRRIMAEEKLKEIAEDYGCSREYVRQVEKKAKNKLRRALSNTTI